MQQVIENLTLDKKITCWEDFEFSEHEYELSESKNWEKIEELGKVYMRQVIDSDEAEELVSYFENQNNQESKEEKVSVNNDIPNKLKVGLSGKKMCYLIVVYIDEHMVQPAGFIYFEVKLPDYDAEDPECLCVSISLDIVYVSPNYRGLGLGFALGTISGIIAGEQLSQLYSQLKGTTVIICPYSYADWVSNGGAMVTEVMNGEIEYAIDTIKECDDESGGKNIDQLRFDGGW